MTQVKMGALDMMRADSRIISALGPVDVAGQDIVETVRALAVCGGPATRLGLLPTTQSRSWTYAPNAFMPDVVSLPACTADTVPAALANLAETGSRSAAITIAVAGDFLIIDLCHGLGDGRLMTLLNGVLGERLSPGRFPDWVHANATANPLGRAIASFFATQPRRLAHLLARPGTKRVEEPDGERVPWRRAPAVVAARSADGAVAELRRCRREMAADLSVASIVFAAIAEEIRFGGIELDDAVNVIFDCRRYLPGKAQVYGNFVSGLDLVVPDPTDPRQLNDAIAAASTSGRPLAALLLSTQRFHRRFRAGEGYLDATSVPRRPRAKLVFSDIGQCFAGSDMWSAGPEHRFFNAISEPKDPECIVFTIVHRGSDIDLTASFHANVFSPEVVQCAVDRVMRQPGRFFVGGLARKRLDERTPTVKGQS